MYQRWFDLVPIPAESRRQINTKYNGTTAEQVGFGDILRLVVGQYGEISQDFHDLLKKLVITKANHISLLE